MLEARPYLQKITLLWEKVENAAEYPFALPAVKNFSSLPFHKDVTFLFGENGSAKSTLVEAIAGVMRINSEGGNINTAFSTSKTHSELHNFLRPTKSYKMPKDHYFLRAESFYNVATYMDDVGYLEGYGGKSLHHQSHGESFMAVLANKFRGNGLYILDEPEAALSPTRQLQALARIHELVQQESQFIIATHSPILLAYPNATIYQITEEGSIVEVAYKDTEHYRVTNGFLNRPEKMLQELLGI